ncbi:MAG TPA: hypothetical protein PKA13_20890 [Geminicoccaceae bacterium]|nr:hypothetical protein [Geminicoccus sp.]HMU52248.1 hypothetical protein [Geminicoccaceae bacterium]
MALLAWLSPAAAQAASVPAGLFGEWDGRAVEAEPPLGEFGDSVRLTIEADGEGFTLASAVGNLDPLGVTMAPTAGEGVFGPSKGGGMLSMFRADDPPDPLDGEPLRWARLADDRLVVYSFEVDSDGSFTLDRYAIARDGEELVLRLTRRDGVADEHVLVARLARAH